MRVSLGRFALVLVAVFAAVVTGAYAADATVTRVSYSGLAEKHGNGVIDWGKEMLYATGEGAVPTAQEEPNRARANLKATDYAKMDAIANLLMLLEGTSISYEATGKDYMADASLRQKIEGYLRNVEILKKEKITEEGSAIIRVTVGTRMYGRETPGTALLLKMCEIQEQNPEPAPVKVEIPAEPPKPAEPAPKPVEAKPKPVETKTIAAQSEPSKTVPKAAVAKPRTASPPRPAVAKAAQPKVLARVAEPKPVVKAVEPKPEPPKAADPPKPPAVKVAEAKVEQPAPASNAASEGPYTSVIIDTLGFNVLRAMAPKIRMQDGSEVWGTLKMDPDEVQDHGPVAYTRTIADARKSDRAGTTPLELKAIGRAGGSRMCDVVLSDEDVARLKAADQSAKPPFLAQLKVIFVVDPVKAF